MNKDLVSIGDVYGKMLNQFKHTHHLKECNKNAFGEQPELVGDGPDTDGWHEALNDEQEKKYNTKRHKNNKSLSRYEEDEENSGDLAGDMDEEEVIPSKKKKVRKEVKEEIQKENKKIAGKTLNNFMSKSVFDKLYNKVLRENFGQEDDTDALGLGDATPDSELDDLGGGDEFGDEDTGDEVTFSLPRELAQQLVDVLQGVLGEEGLGDEGEGDLDFGDEGEGDMDFGDEDNEGMYDEDEEVQGTKVAPDKKAVYQGPTSNNKVTSKVMPKKHKASTDVTDEVGTKDGAPPITALQGKSNQVPGSKVKVGDFFK